MPDPKNPVDRPEIPIAPTESPRLELQGRPAPGRDLELVPDAIPFDAPELAAEGIRDTRLPADSDGRVGTRLVSIAWRARMRWLDDGGR